MEKREAYALQRFKNLTGTVDDPKEDSFTEGHTDKSGSSLDGSCEENSQDMDDLGGCSSIAENMSGIEDGSEINIPSSDVNKICCDINQVYSEVDKLNTEDNISNPSPNTDNFELVDSGGYSVKVDVQLTDDNKLKHATDGFDLPENEVLDHSVKDDCIDAAVITERARCNSNEISDADGAVPDIDNDSDHETDDLLNNESRNSTSKKSEYSLQGTSKYTGNRAIDETGAASDKHDDADEFLNISSGASQKSCNNSSFEDVENQERTNTAEDGSASDKSSSYVNLSNNTDVDSVYSAISYDNDNISLDVSPVKSSANDSSEDTEILELSNETVDKMSAENLDAESDMREDGNPLTLEERLEMIHGANLSFTSNIAALAAAKSRAFGLVEESTYGGETFGDMSDSDEDSSVQ